MWGWQGHCFCSDGDGFIRLLGLPVAAAQLWLSSERPFDLVDPTRTPFCLFLLLLYHVGGWAPWFPFCRKSTLRVSDPSVGNDSSFIDLHVSENSKGHT